MTGPGDKTFLLILECHVAINQILVFWKQMVWIDDETAQFYYVIKHLEAKYRVYKSTHVHKTAQHTCLQHFIRSVPRLETVHYNIHPNNLYSNRSRDLFFIQSNQSNIILILSRSYLSSNYDLFYSNYVHLPSVFSNRSNVWLLCLTY